MLTTPYGGELKDLMVPESERAALRREALSYPIHTLTDRQVCDVELLLNGGFSPLNGFLNRKDYEGVVSDMRLASGVLWPMPITLDVNEETARKVAEVPHLGLYDPEGFLLAVLDVKDVWQPDKRREAELVYGTTSEEHPGVSYLLNQTHPYYVGGELSGVSLPLHYDFNSLRRTPRELREMFSSQGISSVVAFQTRNPMHRAHREIAFRAAQSSGAHLLIHPSVGMTKPGDIDHVTRVRCYQKIMGTYPHGTATLSLLPLAMRMAGPREALWHAIIRRNYGCSHFIIGRDHAGPGKDSTGKDFYEPYAAQRLVAQFQDEIGVRLMTTKEMVYVEEHDAHLPVDEVPAGATVLALSGTELRRKLREGEEIPHWFSYPELIAELRRVHPPKHERGVAIFFTGLSGAGKSTIARYIYGKFAEQETRPVTLLDGDVVRKYLSSELGFSKEHRDLNILRIGFVASEIVKHRGIAICAAIAPYAKTRDEVRRLIEQHGDFIEVYVATPLSVCEERDRKGLYAKARAGLIKQFTGIDDPYELPPRPEVTIDTSLSSPAESAEIVLSYLRDRGYLKNGTSRDSATEERPGSLVGSIVAQA